MQEGVSSGRRGENSSQSCKLMVPFAYHKSNGVCSTSLHPSGSEVSVLSYWPIFRKEVIRQHDMTRLMVLFYPLYDLSSIKVLYTPVL